MSTRPDATQRARSWLATPWLTIRTGGSTADAVPTVQLSTGASRIGAVVVWTALVACAIVLFTGLWVRGPNLVIPFLVIFGTQAGRQYRRHKLSNPVLAEAAIRAANAEGREVRPGVWRLEGDRARALGLELGRLQSRWTPSTTPVAARQDLLVAEARAPLTDYLTRSMALEPPDIVQDSFQPGQTWPTLRPDQRTEPWPNLPTPPPSG